MAVQSSQQLSMDAATQGGFIKLFKSLVEEGSAAQNLCQLNALYLMQALSSGVARPFPQTVPKPSTTIRIFDRTDYYTVHGEDALFTASEVFHTNSVIKHLGSGNSQLPSVILSKPNFESFVRDLLLVKQYRVEVYTCKVKSSNDWKISYKASPGNLQQLEDVVFGRFDMSNSLTIMAVKLIAESGQRKLGVAYAEPSSEVLGVSEFIENDQFSNLEALIVQLRPKECLVVAHDSSSDSRKLLQTLQRSGVLVSERKRSEFSSSDIVQDLDRLLSLEVGETSSSLAQVDLKHATSSLAALIKYLDLLSDESNFGAYKLSTFDFTQYLRLDSSAVRALHLEPQPGDSNTHHLAGLLNSCSSPQGRRLLQQWLRQPLLDKNKIEERLDLVEIFFSDLSLRCTVRDCLKIVPDYFRLAKKLNKGKGSLQDCVRVYQSVCKLPAIVQALTSHEGPRAQLLCSVFTTPLKELYGDFSKYIEMIEATVDLNLSENHEYVIKPAFDKGLTELREEMNKLEAKIKQELKKASTELELEIHKAIKLDFTSQLGYFFRITKKSEKCLRSHKKYRILEAHKDGVRFNTSVVDGLNEEYMSLRREYTTTQASLVTEVLSIASGYTEPMLALNCTLAQLDVLISFAHASAIAPLPYVRPTIVPKGGGDIVLRGCRHPCLEVQDDVSFIANDVSLLRDKESFQIITGPNMGGKSTYMRQIGVTVLMAQIGCFVPCSSASICIVDSILARVGAGDSQLKGISTFMAEMLETASILKSATKDSLVIIDELGRGTSTYDGFGLAWAISEYIATQIGCFCLFATHFHELTLLAEEISTVKNLHVTALTSEDSLTLLYQVQPGPCDRSFGLHVAELAQFPKHVIECAKKKVKELEIWDSAPAKVSSGCDEAIPPEAKRRKLESEEGNKTIAAFISSVRELALLDIAEEEMETRFQALKLDLINTDNEYVKSILSAVS